MSKSTFIAPSENPDGAPHQILPAMSQVFRERVASIFRDNSPMGEAEMHDRIRRLLENPGPYRGGPSRLPNGNRREDFQPTDTVLRPSVVKVDPLVAFYLNNIDELNARMKLYASRAGFSTVDDAIKYASEWADLNDERSRYINTSEFDFLRKMLLLVNVSKKLSKDGKSVTQPWYTEKELNTVYRKGPILHDSSSDLDPLDPRRELIHSDARGYDLDWFQAYTTKTFAEVTAYLAKWGYRLRQRSIDRYTSQYTFSPSKKSKTPMPVVSFIGTKDKSLFFDLFIGDERILAFTYGKGLPGAEEEGVPPSLLDPEFNGILTVNEASRYRDNLAKAKNAVISSIQNVAKNGVTPFSSVLGAQKTIHNQHVRAGTTAYRQVQLPELAYNFAAMTRMALESFGRAVVTKENEDLLDAASIIPFVFWEADAATVKNMLSARFPGSERYANIVGEVVAQKSLRPAKDFANATLTPGLDSVEVHTISFIKSVQSYAKENGYSHKEHRQSAMLESVFTKEGAPTIIIEGWHGTGSYGSSKVWFDVYIGSGVTALDTTVHLTDAKKIFWKGQSAFFSAESDKNDYLNNLNSALPKIKEVMEKPAVAKDAASIEDFSSCVAAARFDAKAGQFVPYITDNRGKEMVVDCGTVFTDRRSAMQEAVKFLQNKVG